MAINALPQLRDYGKTLKIRSLTAAEIWASGIVVFADSERISTSRRAHAAWTFIINNNHLFNKIHFLTRNETLLCIVFIAIRMANCRVACALASACVN